MAGKKGLFQRQIDDNPDDSLAFMKVCIRHIEKKPTLEGLYRVSGLQSQILTMKGLFNSNPQYKLDENTDTHIMTGLLKLFVRELSEPLIPFPLYEVTIAAAVGAVSGQEQAVDMGALQRIVSLLPPPHRACLAVLCEHLKKISSHSDVNKMTVDNLAIVFAPNLLRPLVETTDTILGDAKYATDVIAALIDDWESFFGVLSDSSNFNVPPPRPGAPSPDDLPTGRRDRDNDVLQVQVSVVCEPTKPLPTNFPNAHTQPAMSRFRVLYPDYYGAIAVDPGLEGDTSPSLSPPSARGGSDGASENVRRASGGGGPGNSRTGSKLKRATTSSRATMSNLTLRYKHHRIQSDAMIQDFRQTLKKNDSTIAEIAAQLKEGTITGDSFGSLLAAIRAD
eukprot:TRINITY_DN1461_c0_g1_i1.p1 TRINITY_DN1461_c0_g1~~TRINITY_DN1461_c0_g1_i1.p1  ORF type:complete len:450 (+),score=85.29 TRINITY_DN1461_c0_g1_i1:174-1352(+)